MTTVEGASHILEDEQGDAVPRRWTLDWRGCVPVRDSPSSRRRGLHLPFLELFPASGEVASSRL
ncbi:MAG: hypothetical protein KatS3mg060_2373 [Dehalococcoidia bacterium]|nr:MAG: hypothetical protein KatS3mg060_2373 [Dehalococcoidia bacterium]